MSSNDLALALEHLKILERKREITKLARYKPYKYQIDFHNAVGHKTQEPAIQKVLMAGNQLGKCVTGETLIDCPSGSFRAIDLYEQGVPFRVYSWNGSEVIEADAIRPIKKSKELCVRVWMSNGSWFECSLNHRILSSQDYDFVGSILASSVSLPVCDSEHGRLVHVLSAQNLSENVEGCQDDYFLGSHLYGEQPLIYPEIDQSCFPQQVDARKHNRPSFCSDGLDSRFTSKPPPYNAHLSSLDEVGRILGRCAAYLSSFVCTCAQQTCCCIEKTQHTDSELANQLRSFGVVFLDQSSAYESPCVAGNRIIAYKLVGRKYVFDFSVPQFGNYVTAGVVHHNTYCAANEVAMHLTCNYPDWWKGRRFASSILCLVGGKTNETVRDICQKELFGETDKLGTGTVPLEAIGKRTSKPGVPNAFDTVMVKNKYGTWSKVMFRAYEQGKEKHMGIRINLGWADEEPPTDIWSQYLRATIATNGLLLMTFTPEEGVTEVVNGFMNDIKQGQSLINATWNDAAHLTKEDGTLTDRAQQIMAAFPSHERDMRTRGVPFMGSGLVFPFTEERLAVDPFECPRHWPTICGLDFGFDHPFGAAKLRWDRDNDIVYVVADYSESRALPAIHAASVRGWGDWVPWAWPHDGLNAEKGTGEQLKKSYEEEGLKLLPWKATNPPQAGQKEGEGGNSVEASLLMMYDRMETGRWKVFKTCKAWFSEQRLFHRKDGKLVKLKDDVLSASRYAAMMLRHARVETIKRRKVSYGQGARNW